MHATFLDTNFGWCMGRQTSYVSTQIFIWVLYDYRLQGNIIWFW